MRLGGPTFHASDPESWIAELERSGYRAAYCPLESGAPSDVIDAYARAARKADVVIAEVGAWSNPLSPDEYERRDAIAFCQRQLALAEAVGARCCVNISGSRGPVWDGPHPDHLTDETFHLIVETVRAIIDAVHPTRTFFTLETLNVPGLTRQLPAPRQGGQPHTVCRASRSGQPCLQPATSLQQRDLDSGVLPHAPSAHQELSGLGVRWVGLAPRFVGRFEKGIDYRGDLSALREDLRGHAALARALGPYKLSLHSGSDKFSVYPLFMEATHGLVHLKTAGTSYLEALRVTARVNPGLFREVAALARARFSEERASYHVSAELARVPGLETLSDAELPEMLEQDDARQMLHVTFGSALDHHKEALLRTLVTHETAHYEGLSRHFERHLKPFVRPS